MPPFQDVCLSSFQNRPSQTISHPSIAGLSQKHFGLLGDHQSCLQGLSKILYSVHLIQYLYCLSFCLHNFLSNSILSYFLSGIIFTLGRLIQYIELQEERKKIPQSGVYLKPSVMLTLTYPYLCYT